MDSAFSLNRPELLTTLAGLLAQNLVSPEQVNAACGTVSNGGSITPQDRRWRDIRLSRAGDSLTEIQLTPAEPVPVALFRAWFPTYTEIVGKSHLPRRYLAEFNAPDGPYRVRIVAQVERETITQMTLLREKR